ncbi:Na+/H+ antiporter NhaA [Leucobacter sp. cx-42]|uniref:Na+/H+ antiporter NhaA n=1 Tax=unclassified Leucobacter TaxID=2621730 RepID=UPI00165D5326|nr:MULTISPECIES: Na+/H+ antiporter NhaA [unclassified Leucobacter]MBC9955407.1 Na+/H+ antiporter NhaA [Leucobacter sp. cx-42]
MAEPHPAASSSTDAAPATPPLRGSAIGNFLRRETVGGMLLVIAAIIALIWANSPAADSYFALRNFTIGYEPWHLNLSLGQWASDGLLAIFFFVVGLELKREFVTGDLRKFSTAIVPIAAAAGGVAVPAIIYVALLHNEPDLLGGWAIPTATDIAFAVAVLAIIGSYLPSALRIFLLTLAVVDDLIAIGIIAIFYTDSLHFVPLLLSLLVIAVYGFVAQRWQSAFLTRPLLAWAVLLPLGFAAWALMHASGIHATIAGVLLGFTIPVLHSRRNSQPSNAPGLSESLEHRFGPMSAGFAVPIFAFLAAGVNIGGWDGVQAAVTAPLTLAIVAALVAGKPIGITLVTWLMTLITRKPIDPSIRWIDLIGMGALAGVGFTVSLLVAELSFPEGSFEQSDAKVAIIAASLVAILVASIILVPRNRKYRRIAKPPRTRTY